MEVIEVEAADFDQVSWTPLTPFHTGAFASLHLSKFDALYFLHFKDSRIRAGLTIGVRDGVAYSPFSAPFGGWLVNSKSCTIKQFYSIAESLCLFAQEKAWERIEITLPPAIYDTRYCSYALSALTSAGFASGHFDVNYHFNLELLGDYQNVLWRNAKKNLNRALETDTSFTLAGTESEQKAVYEVIKKNRTQRAFPLRMTFEQVLANASFISIDFLALKLDSTMIAGAVVYHLRPDLVMVVYWGDDIEYMELKVMNVLSYRVFEYYQNEGKKYVDVGPSSEGGIPAFGLCDFKESIGCDVSLKPSLVKQL